MIAVIVGLILLLLVVVVVVNSIQQHKQKAETEKRARVSKQKAIIDENEEMLINLANLPTNPVIVNILNRRSLNAAKVMQEVMPNVKGIKNRIKELAARLQASEDILANYTPTDENFVLPDDEKQLISILQSIKKLRLTIKSEQNKGALDAQTFSQEDQRLDSMQLKINIESLCKRGNQALSKEMLGSSRQYFEKALQSLSSQPKKTEYVIAKQAEISEKLSEITEALKTTNASDAAKKAKSEENDLDMLFQPKKKW